MLLGYKERFTSPIQLGTKIHTMRKPRKIKAKVGETMHMYSALRTRNTKLISNNHTLKSTQRVWIKIHLTQFSKNWDKNWIRLDNVHRFKVCIDGKLLPFEVLEQFVVNDGFTDIQDFVSFWIKAEIDKDKTLLANTEFKLVKSMVLYHWTDLRY